MTSPVAFITGGAGAIGLATGIRLGRRGYRVVLADQSSTALGGAVAAARAASVDVHPIVVDVRSTASVDDGLDAASEWGALATVVNCAGIVDVTAIDLLDDGTWDRVIDINLTGTMRVSRAALAHLGATTTIVMVASVAGRTASTFSSAAYVASKAGVIGLTKSLAAQLAARDIRVNCVAPGIIDTPMIDGYDEEHRRALLQKIPAGRLGVADDVARAIEFLATEDSDFVTGHVLDVNGGQFIA